MANKKSAIKAIKQSKKRRLRNKSTESRIKTFRKKVWLAIENGDKEAAEKNLFITIKEMDKAVSKGIWNRNEAARKKSRLMKRFNSKFLLGEESKNSTQQIEA
ncbi:MAG TPA: 30S ribosomal protein S20 [Candidatus Atribacteria bacterium]|nr:30S ribosomal protein S20 [Candidatus Atribacteria bacterium]